MRYNKLGRTDIDVSEMCLGSMTWGTQNTSQEAHDQIDLALDHGVNFIDTAEMYPVNPKSALTQGRTEHIIGDWIAASGRRADIILATKVVGAGYEIVRDGAPISPATINQALDNSLRALKTDYIDLYQLHWPNRGSYMFRKNWLYDPSTQDSAVVLDHMNETLYHLEKCRDQGKIRHVGLSNESAWGTMNWLSIAAAHNLPRMVSVQNEYSLLCRLFDLDMSELAHHEQVGLLAYSSLAAGLLTGKYQGDTIPPGSRRNFVNDLGGRITSNSAAAVEAYVAVAAEAAVSPAQLALAWALCRPFMTSVIIGATSTTQLTEVLGATSISLDSETHDRIAAVHRRYPMPF